MPCVKSQMILDEGGNEVIAVIIAFLHTHLDRIIGGVAGLLNEVRLELLLKEAIRCPLVDEYWPLLRRLADQYTGVVVRPGGLVLAEIIC